MKKKINLDLNQLSLPFAKGGKQASRALAHVSYDDRVKAFWFLAGASLFALATYVYAVNATAHHVAERAALERQASALSASIATLEFQTIAMKNDITIETAHQYGFVEVAQPLYVAVEKAPALSYNDKRP
jgi:hypothetical protein